MEFKPNTHIKKLYHRNGKLAFKYQYSYIDGIQHGEKLIYGDNGILSIKDNYVNGVKHGEQLSYFRSGELSSKYQYVDGVKNGKQLAHWSNTKLFYEHQYTNGVRHGEQLQYHYTNGDISMKEIYTHGIIQEKLRFWDNGTDWLKWQYVDGELHGEQIELHMDGSIASIRQYISGKKHGKQIELSGLTTEYFILDKEVTKDEWISYEIKLKRMKKLEKL